MNAINAKTRFLDMMNRGEKPYGVFISSIDPAVTGIMGDAGFDFVILDGEHGRNDRLLVENHVRAAAASGTVPLVRVLENSQTLIQSMLDVGAHGLIVPHIDTADDARRAVEASYYSPRGKRGMCPACHAGGYRLKDWISRTRNADDNIVVIPILESKRSIENIEEILAVDGIDIVHFGPGDLSADMGIDLNTEGHLLMEAWHTAMNATRAAGKRMFAPKGFGFDEADMFLESMDYMLLSNLADKLVTDHKSSQ